MKNNIDLTTIKRFILTNALNGDVMLMLHPSNFARLAKSGTKTIKSLCVNGINIIADNNGEVSEDEIDVLEIKFS